jgi:acyl carrier protein
MNTLQEKLNALEEMMELDEGTLSPETSLDDVEEWDSLAALSLVVLLKEEFDKKITGQEIRAFLTIRDILNVMEKQQGLT